MDRIRFGVIGAGMISQSCCGEIQGHEKVEIVAASDPNQKRLAELKDKFNIPQTYANNNEIIASNQIDALYIAVPTAFHAPLALAALKAGKHVILDKPFALNYNQAKEMADAAKASGKVFMLGMNFRYLGNSQRIRSIVKSGKLGEIYHVKAFWFRRTGIPKFGTWFCQKKIAGGGVLLDIGVHLLDAALFALDNFEPLSVTGATYSKFGNRDLGEGGWGMSDAEEHIFDVDDFATALIKLKGGCSLSLDVSWAIHQSENDRMDVQLYGTEGSATLISSEIYRYGDQPGEYIIVQNPSAEVPYPHENRFVNFINCILGDEQPLTPVEESLVVQKILDGIYASSESGKEIRLDN